MRTNDQLPIKPGLGVWLVLLAWLSLSSAIAAPVITEHVEARLLAERQRVAPGSTVDLALVFDIIPHWHTYWLNPGDSGEPPRIRWHLPDGIEAGPIRWPIPELIRVGPLANYGYSGRATHLIALKIPDHWPAGEPIPIRADITWLVCDEECIPEQGSFELTLATAARPGPIDTETAAIFADVRSRLPASEPISARLTPTDGTLRLAVPLAMLPEQPTQAHFFAGEWGLIEHSATQPRQIDADHLIIDLVPGEAPESASPNGLLVIETAAGPQGFEITTTVGARVPVSADAGLGLPLALLFALLGGLVLNLMPCVFPVLAIKALGLAQESGTPLRRRALHGLAYTAGVLTFFALVAVILLVLRAGGAAIGWGFQLQSPVLVIMMAYLFLVLGLGLAGALTLGTSLMGLGGTGPATQGTRRHWGAFVTGALAALVAAPCTAPFMGAALGYALTLPPALALVIMLTLGLGLALPFFLLTLSPWLAARLPRPGAWMEHLKQFLAFPLLATAAWLVWVLSVQTGPAGVATVLTGMLALTFGLWLLERGRNGRAPWRQLSTASAIAAIAAALWLGIAADRLDTPASAGQAGDPLSQGRITPIDPRPYSPELLAEALADGRPVFVNMTAAWCITCLVNERVALRGNAIATAFAERDLLYLKGDWTNRDAGITHYLADFARTGVPLYVYYPVGGEPTVLPQLLTEGIVLDALDEADAVTSAASAQRRLGSP